jgi:probable rRNA maturation factor
VPIKFTDIEVKSKLKQKRALGLFIETQIAKATKRKCHLQYVFVNDEQLLQMNQQFLAHDTFTDIITFDLSEEPNTILGEIYISTERVADNAQKFKVDYFTELHRVIFHGALHLCGYKDKSRKDKEEMRCMEDLWLKGWEKAAQQ